jgi:hypothetical protein
MSSSFSLASLREMKEAKEEGLEHFSRQVFCLK